MGLYNRVSTRCKERIDWSAYIRNKSTNRLTNRVSVQVCNRRNPILFLDKCLVEILCTVCLLCTTSLYVTNTIFKINLWPASLPWIHWVFAFFWPSVAFLFIDSEDKIACRLSAYIGTNITYPGIISAPRARYLPSTFSRPFYVNF